MLTNPGTGFDEDGWADAISDIRRLFLLVSGGANDLNAGSLGVSQANLGEGVTPAPVIVSGTYLLAAANLGDLTSVTNAQVNLGLGSMALQNSSAVTIVGGSITGITDLAIADGGTGASDAGTARSNLGLLSMAIQSSTGVAITGGNVTANTLSVESGGSFAVYSGSTFIVGGSSMDVKIDVRSFDAAESGDAYMPATVYQTGQSTTNPSARNGLVYAMNGLTTACGATSVITAIGPAFGSATLTGTTRIQFINPTSGSDLQRLTLTSNNIAINPTPVGSLVFFTTSGGNSKQTVNGVKSGTNGTTLGNLLTALAAYGLITDSTT